MLNRLCVKGRMKASADDLKRMATELNAIVGSYKI